MNRGSKNGENEESKDKQKLVKDSRALTKFKVPE